MDHRGDRALSHRNRPRRRRFPPRHLPGADRDHHRRTDDGRLRLGGHAGELPPLVLRQAFPLHRKRLQARPDGPGLRDRDQLQPLHRLPDGGKHPHHAGSGDRPRGLRPQQLLQGQLPVPHLDQRRRHHRLPHLRAELHHRLRRALRRRRSRASPRLLPCSDELRRRPLQAPPAAVAGQGKTAPARARGIPPEPGQRPLAHPPRPRHPPRPPGRTAFPARAGRKPALLHRKKRPPARALAA